MESVDQAPAVHAAFACALAVRHLSAPDEPCAGELPACEPPLLPYRSRTRTPSESARIAPPSLSSPSRAPCLFSRMLRFVAGGPSHRTEISSLLVSLFATASSADS